MYRALLLYDLRQSRNLLLVLFTVLVFFLHQIMMGAMSPPAFLLIIGLWTSIFPLVFLAREDRFRSVVTTCSLPICRNDLVRFRYITCWILSATLTLILGFARLVFRDGLTTKSIGEYSLALLIALGVMALFFSLVLPLIYRFGYLGLMVFLIGTQVLGPLVIIFFSPKRPSSSPSAISATIQPLLDGLTSLRLAMGNSFFWISVMGLLLLMQFVSYRVSQFLFRRREF